VAGQGLRPAPEVWTDVHSRPEPQRVMLGLGKRGVWTDASRSRSTGCARAKRI
jgi:D-serine deaminase-like pyridoxal phosphate-dependent protein